MVTCSWSHCAVRLNDCCCTLVLPRGVSVSCVLLTAEFGDVCQLVRPLGNAPFLQTTSERRR